MGSPFPWSLLFLLQVLHAAIGYPTLNNHVRKWILGPTTIGVTWFLWTQSASLPKVGLAYTIGSTIGNQLFNMASLVYVQPEGPNFWRRVKDGDRLPSSFGLGEKVEWTVDLVWGVRKVGWVQEPKGVLPPRPKFNSRISFVASRMGYAFLHFLVLDLLNTYTVGNPAFDSRVHLTTDGADAYMRSQPVWWRMVNVTVTGVIAICSIGLPFNLVPAISVGLGLYKPEDWLPIFGSFKEAYTVRAFWGKSWHQMMRSMLSGIGKRISNETCGFTQGTNLSAYTQLYIGFLISGLIHMAGDYMVMQKLAFFSPRWFLLQAMAITFEDFVQWCTKSWRPKMGWTSKAIGYIYVITWFTWCGPLWFDYMSKNGQASADRGVLSGKLLEFWISS